MEEEAGATAVRALCAAGLSELRMGRCGLTAALSLTLTLALALAPALTLTLTLALTLTLTLALTLTLTLTVAQARHARVLAQGRAARPASARSAERGGRRGAAVLPAPHARTDTRVVPCPALRAALPQL